MIASLSGVAASVAINQIVVDVSGVGYRIHVTPVLASSVSVGEKLNLHTSQIVREDSISLFGFADFHSRDFFELLLTVSGVGPRVALSMLSAFSPEDIADAIVSDSPHILEKIPGIGKKVASRLILELRDKVSGKTLQSKSTTQQNWSEQLLAALTGLGYKNKDAERAIERVKSSLGDKAGDRELSELLKMSLSNAAE